ncbi:TPA: acylglycerol kinase family protein [Legionella pneumophila]|uniref:diacylglycerol/lipid kinase family protein n=1 Tax=Legionella pneumophila TaxID=446 RepID=UPI002E230571
MGELHDRHCGYYQLCEADPQQLENYIQDCCSKYPLLLIGGGDGTVRSAAQWCTNTSVVLGVLPLGTMNHFSKELNLPSTTEELITAIQEKITTTIDFCYVNRGRSRSQWPYLY